MIKPPYGLHLPQRAAQSINAYAASAVAKKMKLTHLLNVEVRLKSVRQLTEVRREVTQWLRDKFSYVEIDKEITGFDMLGCASNIDAIHVVDCLPHDVNPGHYALENVHLAVHVYTLHHTLNLGTAENSLLSSMDNEEVDSLALTLHNLPHIIFDGTWQSLHFETTIREELLHELTQMLAMERKGSFSVDLHDWTGLVLLHGPPGSGKTSLCKALAQKLAIRSSDTYSSFYLVEINANNLHSKWFGESGKIIAKVFSQIYTMAQDPDEFICVLIDEVETIAGSRQRSTDSGEVGDALRATNQLLTALDELRFHPNVLIFCTTNLMATLDEAFLSRVDTAEFVGLSTPNAAYEILRSCLNDLIWTGLIEVDEKQQVTESNMASGETMDAIDKYHGYKPKDPFPNHKAASLRQHTDPDCLPSMLLAIATDCAGFSGRQLRRLPRRAIARHTHGACRSAEDVLIALRLTVEKEAVLNRQVA